MSFYLFQASYTPEAIKAMIATPQDRHAAAEKMITELGGTLHHLFFSFGAEDVVALIEVPDDVSMVAGSLLVGGSGAFSAGRTTKLITIEESMEAMRKAHKAAASYTPATG